MQTRQLLLLEEVLWIMDWYFNRKQQFEVKNVLMDLLQII